MTAVDVAELTVHGIGGGVLAEREIAMTTWRVYYRQMLLLLLAADTADARYRAFDSAIHGSPVPTVSRPS